jgi:hypothetical protein
MGAAAWFTSEWLQDALPGRQVIWKAVQVFSAIAVGILVLAASAKALRIAEFDEALKRVLRRLQHPRRS